MLNDAIKLLNAKGFIDGNDLPDSAPGHTYHFRSVSRSIVPAPHVRKEITAILKDAGFKIKSSGGMLILSK